MDSRKSVIEISFDNIFSIGMVTLFCNIKATMKENTLTVKTISTNIFRYVNNYIVDKHHVSKEKDGFIIGPQNVFLKEMEK